MATSMQWIELGASIIIFGLLHSVVMWVWRSSVRFFWPHDPTDLGAWSLPVSQNPRNARP